MAVNPFTSLTRIYRFNIGAATADQHRFQFGETLAAEAPSDLPLSLGISCLIWANLWRYPFGVHEPTNFADTDAWWNRLWPPNRSQTTNVVQHDIQLNSAAPEGSFRLQRVGADGGIGRMLIPILDDSYYTDRPRRRHVNVSDLDPLLQARVAALPPWYAYGPAKLYRCIVHRKARTYELVSSYELLANPVRRWQRWRKYDFEERGEVDSLWTPEEFDQLER